MFELRPTLYSPARSVFAVRREGLLLGALVLSVQGDTRMAVEWFPDDDGPAVTFSAPMPDGRPLEVTDGD